MRNKIATRLSACVVLSALAACGPGNNAGETGTRDGMTSETGGGGDTSAESAVRDDSVPETGEDVVVADASDVVAPDDVSDSGPVEMDAADASDGAVTPPDADPGEVSVDGAVVPPDGTPDDTTSAGEGGTGTEAGAEETGAGDGGCATGTSSCAMGGTATCVNLQTDPQNCGTCGTVCGAGQTCTAGSCGCAAGSTTCGSGMMATCTNLMSDDANCGMCGRACPTGQSCTMGACGCATGSLACGMACVDPQTDNANCGMCGNACPMGRSCVAGACACPMGTTSCGTGATATCENTQTDNANCGACGTACPAGRSCAAGVCACPMGQTSCGTGATATCVNTASDNANCGACGMACTGGATCVMGACACATGQTRCGTGAAAACTDTATDSANCGACGMACPSGQVCSMGMCRSTCTAPTVPCGSGASMTCANTQNDDQNCGACGTVCGTVPNSFGGLCTTGTCRPICTSGFANCNTTYADGCEVNITNNLSNCGSCGATCPTTATNATGVTCAASRCTPTCQADTATTQYRDCNASVADGCETNIIDNANHCGACGNVCPAGLGCFNGLCTPRSCSELHTARPALGSGEYDIDTDGTGPNPIIRVYCDMTTQGGGWTLIGTVHNGAPPAADTRSWDSLAAFTGTTTFGSIAARATGDFKSPAWSQLASRDLMVQTNEYHFGFTNLLGGVSFGSYINTNWPATCNTTWARSGADFVSTNLSMNQQRSLGFSLRALDNNAGCFPGTNEQVAVAFNAASCCWVNGLGNTPGGQAEWRTHDLSMPTLANLVPQACTGGYPCNANLLVQNASFQSYDRSRKAAYAMIWAR